MRIILTGSRRWPDDGTVFFELGRLFCNSGPFTLVHGACATGADAQAHHWYEVAGRALGCAEERFPAEWGRLGKRAGPVRNVHMIEAGADLVLAFPLPGGSGTQHTVELAEQARIPVRKVRPREVADIEFRNPPIADRNRAGVGPHYDAAKELRERPTEWGIVARYRTRRAAASIAYQIRVGGMNAYAPAGAYDAVSRTEDGEFRVYARYMGLDSADRGGVGDGRAPNAPAGA